MISKPTFTLTVEAGPDKKGATFVLAGAPSQTLGRSSRNLIALCDPLLSREHCRFDNEGESLWVVDLNSANQTQVNEVTVKRRQLQAGDIVAVGDTRLRVGISTVAAAAVAPADSADASAPIIDLGLGEQPSSGSARTSLRPILYTVGAIVIVLLAATFILTAPNRDTKNNPEVRPALPTDDPVQIIYEKIEASPASVFRYELTISPARLLTVRIDDLSQNRVVRKEKPVETALLQELARAARSSGFFSLDSDYVSAPGGAEINTWDLTVILGRQAHHVRIANRPEPAPFAALREKIETFGQSELGIWAIQYSTEKLTELAHDSLLVARKRMDERDLRYGNIALAIISYRDAEVCLDTVEPKPDFYQEIVRGRTDAEAELDRRYKEYRFQADRAINLRNWEDARAQLRVICELIPDRADNRYRDADTKLLDVEQRILAVRKKKH